VSNTPYFHLKPLPQRAPLPVIAMGEVDIQGEARFHNFLSAILYISEWGVDGAARSIISAQDLPGVIDWIYATAGAGKMATLDRTHLRGRPTLCIQANSAGL
jgi:hypothetical protein